jgi:hypothetical protein
MFVNRAQLCAAMVASLLAPAVNAAPAPIRFGPIEFGTSLEQIQAAVPEARWQTTSRSEYTGRAFKIAAEEAIEFGGRRMKVEAHRQKYDWDMILTSRTTEASPEACEQAGLAMLTALEDSAGRLHGAPDPQGETLNFGRGSTARFLALDDRSRPIARKKLARSKVDRLSLSAGLEAEQLDLDAYAAYDARNAANCLLSITAIGWRERPPPSVITFDEKKIVRRMSVGDRHRLASTLDLPAAGVTVPVQCQVSRQSGKVLTCQPRADAVVASEVVAVAGRYAGALAFDMSGLDRDDPQPVLVEIPVCVAPEDIRSLVFAGPLLPMSDVAFEAVPPAREVQLAYPIDARRKGVAARVETTCQVQSDGSLVCRTPIVHQRDGRSDLRPEFERAVEKLVPMYRAAPALKDGKPSAGVAFGMAVAFELAE